VWCGICSQDASHGQAGAEKRGEERTPIVYTKPDFETEAGKEKEFPKERVYRGKISGLGGGGGYLKHKRGRRKEANLWRKNLSNKVDELSGKGSAL